MGALVKVVRLLMQQAALPDADMSQLLALVTAALFKQALERISRVRQTAAASLRELLEQAVRTVANAKAVQHAQHVAVMLETRAHIPTGGLKLRPTMRSRQAAQCRVQCAERPTAGYHSAWCSSVADAAVSRRCTRLLRQA
jgi:D-aminopeptidase